MRVVIAGRGPIAVRAATLYRALSQVPQAKIDEVVCVPSPDQNYRTSFTVACAENGWSTAADIKSTYVQGGDVLLSLQWPQHITESEIGSSRAVNLHFSALPRHRGSLSAFWPVFNRDKTIGVTLHEIAPRIDAGPIIGQHIYDLPQFVSAGRLFDLFQDMGFELLTQFAWRLLKGTYIAEAQSSTSEPPHRRRDVNFREVDLWDFSGDAEDVRARCLAMIAPGFQLPTYLGTPVEGAFVAHVPEKLCGPGDVLAQDGNTVLVGCERGVIGLELKPRGGPESIRFG